MYKITLTNRGGKEFQVCAGDHSFVVEPSMPGASPLDYFLAGLGACIGYYLRVYCTKNDINVPEFAVVVTGELNTERPVRFTDIAVNIDLKDAQIDNVRRRGLLEFIRNCPAHNTLKGSPVIDITL